MYHGTVYLSDRSGGGRGAAGQVDQRRFARSVPLLYPEMYQRESCAGQSEATEGQLPPESG